MSAMSRPWPEVRREILSKLKRQVEPGVIDREALEQIDSEIDRLNGLLAEATNPRYLEKVEAVKARVVELRQDIQQPELFRVLRVVQTDSHGPIQFIDLAVSLVNYLQGQYPGDHKKVMEACGRLWPGCDIYRGGTHIRVTVTGDYSNQFVPAGVKWSFYVDLSGQRKEP